MTLCFRSFCRISAVFVFLNLNAPAQAEGEGPGITGLPPVGEFHLPEAEPVAPLGVAVELVFDASGSMAGKLGGRPKIDLAREALAAAAAGLNGEMMQVAFRAYGFDRTLAKTPEASCPNTELLMPFTRAGQAGGVAAISKSLTAYGYTPIARSLELAGQDLMSVTADQRFIILISDGEETCGGDPTAVAAYLRELGIDLTTHVVGFDLDATARRQMTDIAHSGGGHYFDANDGAQLGASLVSVIELAREAVDPYDERLIRPVRGGLSFEDAVVIGPGAYTLDTHLEKGEERFFRVETKVAQRALLRAIIQSRKILIGDDGEAVESEIAHAGFQIQPYTPAAKPIKGHGARVYGERGEQAFTAYVDLTGQGVVFSIGDRYSAVNKDALFVVEVDEAGDIQAGQDAPPEVDAALIWDAANAATGHLGIEDRFDVYRIDVPAGSAARLAVGFTDPEFRFLVDIRDAATNRRITRFTKLVGAADLEWTVPDGVSAVTMQIKDNNPGLDIKFSSYTVDLSLR